MHVRFGSKADICGATSHVRFTPIATAKVDFPQTVMSALAPKADVCDANRHVCFGPIADMGAIKSVQGVMRPLAAKLL